MYNDETKEEFLKHMSESYDKLFEIMQSNAKLEPSNIIVELAAADWDNSSDTFISSSNFSVDEERPTFHSFSQRKMI